MKSTYASVHFNQIGTPVADNFDDVYFSNDSGMEETQYVFLAGNNLHERWQNWRQPTFVIAETGFGTGLNLLVVMTAFREFRKANPDHPLTRLYFITTEKFPLSQQDMAHALSRFTALTEAANTLQAQYPFGLNGCHRLLFDNFATTVDLWLSDVHDAMSDWQVPEHGLVDAWFLDGFAPSKNPQMWTDELFINMARCSRQHATCATFTAAGLVKRGLQAAGFTVSKRKGFGRKREMITAVFTSPKTNGNSPTKTRPTSVTIIGGGIAAASLAYSLSQKGISTALYCAHEPADGASGNPQGGLYPQLHAQPSIASQLQAHAFLFARRFYQHVSDLAEFKHDFCGVLQLGFNESVRQRQQRLLENGIWPQQLIRPVDELEAEHIAGIPLPYSGLHIPLGGWINPPSLIDSLLNLAQNTGHLTVHRHHRLVHLKEHEGQTQLGFDNGHAIEAQCVVLATGHELADFEQCADLPLRAVRGQVEAVATQAPLNQLKTVLCHKGYLTPAFKNRHALGSTYVKRDTATDVRLAESQQNLALHQQALKNTKWINTLCHDGSARAAIRLGVPDHQPLCGPLPEVNKYHQWYQSLRKYSDDVPETVAQRNIYVLSALGSRGLTTAPLLAESLACQLCHQPSPLGRTLAKAVNPNRFLLKELKQK
ncbi:bifunctional tRNA (5-methylaminomethyl-2-thiouridine)(34)-methyltransferase MnmD/FAD-dependent 5-carboxymethylaminomethyl-2-thiouridine(34) oxidoreductase MnmC [Alteromonas ponticola]|uniref:tRNA 5-methylaminomethyl-2-thiouridine biosynthesis bifunctional protein MnmC n=1 Tax=Alteromonas aquimaris TaxID=2998417 RepID=A0ABT3P898_9ALTE|nr:bifunctional tRNA (5-methylaminomethyl-2-thiouridine)(34)-methyltransferase MnmD/FAD-dependent 5-carboxymethylaminomethyl-2-thiouridine(34) oxidoreductase MnmC [Alteromonas aquimaris]MCW8108316.1 bifunctional tRNA (5-methylaminomethyl-2-thiouridine)(34)-methyltransferase MnmD/FAD-dependent 5-carboxymethylaminomethyl-2-thiouridine(34) oxidoreductase MnmC [Alteromonas aquimaris]